MTKSNSVKIYALQDSIAHTNVFEYIEVPTNLHNKKCWSEQDANDFYRKLYDSLTDAQLQTLTEECTQSNQEMIEEEMPEHVMSVYEYLRYIASYTLENQQLTEVL
jgi:hypothetical protein